MTPLALVPRIVWQLAQAPVQEVLLAALRGGTGRRRGRLLLAGEPAPEGRRRGSSVDVNDMWACCSPQNSRHWPR